jgi:phosphoglycolate phosphatase
MPLATTYLQACIVDLDGTLIDTLGDFEQALASALKGLGYPPVDRAFIARTVGRGSEHLLERALAQVGAPAALLQTAWAAYQQHYLAINGRHSAVYPGAAEGLAALRELGLPLVCLTNKPGAFARPLLAAKGLAGHFLHVFGGDAFERKKPDPLPLLQACRAMGAEPAHTLMVGDSRNDAQAARAAGCPVVLMRYGYNHGEPAESAAPDAVLDRIDELPAWFRANGLRTPARLA